MQAQKNGIARDVGRDLWRCRRGRGACNVAVRCMTLHTNGAPETIYRLMNMGAEPYRRHFRPPDLRAEIGARSAVSVPK